MTKQLTRFIKHAALALSYALVILAGVMFCAPKYDKRNNLKDRLNAIERENEEIQQKIHDTRRKQERIQNDPDYLDKEVREILGEVGPYVLVVNFLEPAPQ